MSILANFLALKASQVPKYEPCHHKSLLGRDISTIILIIFAFRAAVTLKNSFFRFWGARDLETSGYDA